MLGPLLYSMTQLLPDPPAAHIVPDDQATDNHHSCRLQMAFDSSIDPSDDLALYNCGKGHSFVTVRELFNTQSYVVLNNRVPERCT